jgi:hypothetical protein
VAIKLIRANPFNPRHPRLNDFSRAGVFLLSKTPQAVSKIRIFSPAPKAGVAVKSSLISQEKNIFWRFFHRGTGSCCYILYF